MELKQEAIGKKLRILREIHNYTQEYVATQLNIKQKAYSNLETGVASLNLERCQQLASLYKMNLTDFVSYLQSNEKIVVHHVTGRDGVGGVIQGTINVHNYGLAEKEKEVYEKKITLLEQEINLLKQQNELLKK